MFPPLLSPASDAPSQTPDHDALLLQHAWGRSVVPWWNSSADLVDIVRDYGATPDWVNATDDDGPVSPLDASSPLASCAHVFCTGLNAMTQCPLRPFRPALWLWRETDDSHLDLNHAPMCFAWG